jgi:hypothetical protein
MSMRVSGTIARPYRVLEARKEAVANHSPMSTSGGGRDESTVGRGRLVSKRRGTLLLGWRTLPGPSGALMSCMSIRAARCGAGSRPSPLTLARGGAERRA